MMNDKANQGSGWISSLDIINKTGISRATLNNYIKMNLLPRPTVKKPEETDVRARMLGYFPESVIDLILQIKEMKNNGLSMDAISERLRQPEGVRSEEQPVYWIKTSGDENASRASLPEDDLFTSAAKSPRETLKVTISNIPCPAYLLNNNFEIDWVNPEA